MPGEQLEHVVEERDAGRDRRSGRRRRERASSADVGLLRLARDRRRRVPWAGAGARRACSAISAILPRAAGLASARRLRGARSPPAGARPTRACASSPSSRARRAAAGPSRASVARPGLDQARALHEVVDAERRREARRAAGRQHVVRAGEVVAEGLRRVRPEEDRAGVADARQPSVAGVRTSSSRCSGASRFASATASASDAVTTIAPKRASERAASARRGSAASCSSSAAATRAGESPVGRDADRRGQRIVLGLRQQVGRDQRRRRPSRRRRSAPRSARRSSRCRPGRSTSRFAVATQTLPGPTILSTRGIVAVP